MGVEDEYSIWTEADMANGVREITDEEVEAEFCLCGCEISEGCLYHRGISEICQWCDMFE